MVGCPMFHLPEWLHYFAGLAARSWILLWSWTGMGWAAAAVSTLLFGVGVYQQANTSYRQRYAGFSWEAIFDSLWQVSLRPTLRNWKTKIALGAWICFYLIAVGRVSWTDHLDSMQKITELRTKNQELEGRLKARTVEASRL